MALYWTLRLATWLLRAVPLRASYAVARLAGVATYYAWRGGRRRCIRNMLHVSGGDAARARAYARRSFAYYGVYLVDFMRLGMLRRGEVLKRVDFEAWDTIDGARTGNGVVFVTMHFGNWDLAGAALVEHGLPVTTIADTFAHQRTNDLIVGARQRLGLTIVPAERMGPGVLRALRRDDVVALLIDVPQQGSGVDVEFFGATVTVPDGAARIALRTGAPVVVGGLARLGPASDRFEGMISRVPFAASGDLRRDVRELTQATMRALEQMVRRYPDQWYIFRSLWRDDRDAGAAA